MSRFLTALLVLSVATALPLSAQEAPPPDLALVGDSCFMPKVARCCKLSNATLVKKCQIGRDEWFCRSTPATNTLMKTTVTAPTGWTRSKTTGNEGECVYRKPTCGNAVDRCGLAQANTRHTCAEKVVAGTLCESATFFDGEHYFEACFGEPPLGL